MDSSQKIHFVYWCRLTTGASGPLSHTKDFIRAIQCYEAVGFVTVFGKNPGLKEIEKDGQVNVVVVSEGKRFHHFFFLLGQVRTLLCMLRIQQRSGIPIFYFRHTSFLFLPILLRLLGGRNIYIEVNGIPNQDLLEGRIKPFLRYLRKLLLFSFDRILFQSLNGLFTVCDVFKKNLLEKYKIKKDIEVIPNGYFPQEVQLVDRNDGKRRLGLDPETKYAIYVGNLTYYEGVEFLLRAFLYLCNHPQYDNRVLLILGRGGLEEELKTMVPPAMAKRVLFLGFVPKEAMRLYIAASHVGVYTPLEVEYGIDGQRGGSPLKMVDYLSMGRPVLVPRSVYYDYVDKYQCGARYEPGDNGSFVRMLAILTEDEVKNRKWGENAHEYAISHLDWRFTLEPIYSMIDSHAEKSEP